MLSKSREVSHYFEHNNFLRMHVNFKMALALASGVSDTFRDITCVVDLIDAATLAPTKCDPYKKKSCGTLSRRRSK